MLAPWMILALLLAHFGATVLFIQLVSLVASKYADPIPGIVSLAALYIGWIVGATYGVRIYVAA